MDNWAQIRVLRAQGMSIRKIAAQVGCAKKTVERALASNLTWLILVCCSSY
ncbi:helix-turn-helix domain-containing protein [Corynebacterium belfantii]|uniref:helix-turn-helix domain-containing protein n=1 Tax=Corynebacterium belfantii TaxID=2014537 RepID=UPI0018D3B26C|nr:helix-turn-helix domain-containing protein [Corynebacterium belfantii]